MPVKEMDTVDQTIEETAKGHTLPMSDVQHDSRRRRNLVCRVNFYDRRTECVIGTPLKVFNLLNTTDSNMLCTSSNKTNQPSACASQPSVLPDQLLFPSPSLRLRSTVVRKATSGSQFMFQLQK
ncbi:hypothetical protein EG68_11910 [Paragonimus skrjabini miyazakii]|uniref:Uncharacterized protein n=1 Tax=Paragonimus skrjabini miyazakii TaxID=59628 RepID=A0A8S9YDS7_9TREM|nr:hypothetical protein EG68_11910 [Paragonimus skrjabini miyazakii]